MYSGVDGERMWLLEFEASGMGTTVWGRLSGD